MTDHNWIIKWRNLRGRCKTQNKEFSLTIEDYIQLALDAGLTCPSQIGTGINDYQMGRIGDVGGYHLGNCRFITHRQNQLEKVDNGKTTIGRCKDNDAGVSSMSITKTGRTKDSHPYIKSQSDKLKGRQKSDFDYIKTQSEKVSKSFRLVSPSGEIHEGRNLSLFSKINGLTNSQISEVCSGKKKQYKGWTGTYV